METFCVFKVSFLYLPFLFSNQMKCKILEKAGEMFLIYGFKSVTMDDIAENMGISKKTIYAHFKNKTKLVEATTMALFEHISNGIDCICALEKNPIEEIFNIKEFLNKNLKDEKSSPQYQLQKYYPSLFVDLKKKQLEMMLTCVTQNLERGIKLNLYREELDLNFTARIYFNGVVGIKDQDTFPAEEFDKNYLLETFLSYHIRAIATEKGVQKLEKILLKNEN